MYSDSPDRISFESKQHRVEWYDSPSNDITSSGSRLQTQRVSLRAQHEAYVKKEADEKIINEIKCVDFDLSADDDDDNDGHNDSLFALSLNKPLSIDNTSPDLIWKKEKTADNNEASKILSALPKDFDARECLNLANKLLSKPSTSQHSDIVSSSTSSSMVTPTTNRKRPAQFILEGAPLATSTPINPNQRAKPPPTSTPIAPNRMVKPPPPSTPINPNRTIKLPPPSTPVNPNRTIKLPPPSYPVPAVPSYPVVKKPRLSNNIHTLPKITKFDDSFNDETLDDVVFDRFKITHPEIAKKAESQASSQASQLPDILSTPKPNRTRFKPSTPMYNKSKSLAEERSLSSRLPSIRPAAIPPPKQTIPPKNNSNTPMRKAKSFANDDDDDFYNDNVFT